MTPQSVLFDSFKKSRLYRVTMNDPGTGLDADSRVAILICNISDNLSVAILMSEHFELQFYIVSKVIQVIDFLICQRVTKPFKFTISIYEFSHWHHSSPRMY